MQSDSKGSQPQPNQHQNQHRNNQMHVSYLERRKMQMREEQKKREKQEERKRLEIERIREESKNLAGGQYQQYGGSQVSTYEQQEEGEGSLGYRGYQENGSGYQLSKIIGHGYGQVVEEKKITEEEILKNGQILKVVDRCLSKNDFKIQCKYDGEFVQILASKQEIVKKNVIPLLDYYEKHLGLR